MPLRDVQDAWVQQMFAVPVGPASTQGGGGPAKGGKGPLVVFRQAMLRWRAAQAALAGHLDEIGRTLLARDDVKGDPRLDQVKQAVTALPGLVPQFGGALEDVLDAGIDAGPGAQAADLSRRAVAAIDEYRQVLAADRKLAELEAFAAKELGKGVALQRALDGELAGLRALLAEG